MPIQDIYCLTDKEIERWRRATEFVQHAMYRLLKDKKGAPVHRSDVRDIKHTYDDTKSTHCWEFIY